MPSIEIKRRLINQIAEIEEFMHCFFSVKLQHKLILLRDELEELAYS